MLCYTWEVQINMLESVLNMEFKYLAQKGMKDASLTKIGSGKNGVW